MDGEPTAVNLGSPGITSPGWGSFILTDLLKPLEGVLGWSSRYHGAQS